MNFKKYRLVILGLIVMGASSAMAVGVVKLKRFYEISSSFEAMTGVSSQYTDIRKFFLQRTTFLPQLGEMREVSKQSIFATAGLASLYCAKMIQKDKANANASSRWMHQFLDFTKAPKDALNPAILDQLIQQYSQNFWLRSPSPEEKDALSNLAMDLRADVPADAVGTEKIVVSLCSLMLSTFSSITY